MTTWVASELDVSRKELLTSVKVDSILDTVFANELEVCTKELLTSVSSDWIVDTELANELEVSTKELLTADRSDCMFETEEARELDVSTKELLTSDNVFCTSDKLDAKELEVSANELLTSDNSLWILDTVLASELDVSTRELLTSDNVSWTVLRERANERLTLLRSFSRSFISEERELERASNSLEISPTLEDWKVINPDPESYARTRLLEPAGILGATNAPEPLTSNSLSPFSLLTWKTVEGSTLLPVTVKSPTKTFEAETLPVMLAFKADIPVATLKLLRLALEPLTITFFQFGITHYVVLWLVTGDQACPLPLRAYNIVSIYKYIYFFTQLQL